MSKSFFLSTIPFLVLFVASSVFAGITVTPAYVTFEVNEGNRHSGQFVIANQGASQERYRIKALNFTFDETGQFRVLSQHGRSLAKWIKFNPREFTLPPKSKRIVRYVITPRGKTEDGSYWAAMELETLTPREHKSDAGKQTVHLKVIESIVIPIIGEFGKTKYTGELRGIGFKNAKSGSMVEAEIANTGNAIVQAKGLYRIFDGSGSEVLKGEIGDSMIFPGTSHKVSTALKEEIKPGSYRLEIEYLGGNLQTPVSKEIPVVVK